MGNTGCDIKPDFDVSFLKIAQILTESQELEDQNDAVNHDTNELFHFGCYLDVYVCVESVIHMLNSCQDFFRVFNQLISDD